MKEEIWRPIPGYEYLYQASSLGRIKSMRGKETIMKPSLNNKGYYRLILSDGEGNIEYCQVHRLIALTFLNVDLDNSNCVVDHIDNDCLNNDLSNLQLVSKRENCSKDRIEISSRYPGVCRHRAANKWVATIKIEGKSKYLGLFEEEEDAFESYLNALKDIDSILFDKYKLKF